MSQAQFGAEVLGLKEITIARYETSHPPKGEQLLRLQEVAQELAGKYEEKLHHRPPAEEKMRTVEKLHRFIALSRQFTALYMDELLKQHPRTFTPIPATASEDAHGYLLTKVIGVEGIIAAECFVALQKGLTSTNLKKRKIAVGLLKKMEEATFELQGTNRQNREWRRSSWQYFGVARD